MVIIYKLCHSIGVKLFEKSSIFHSFHPFRNMGQNCCTSSSLKQIFFDTPPALWNDSCQLPTPSQDLCSFRSDDVPEGLGFFKGKLGYSPRLWGWMFDVWFGWMHLFQVLRTQTSVFLHIPGYLTSSSVLQTLARQLSTWTESPDLIRLLQLPDVWKVYISVSLG